jgi:hypothetical protein
VKPLYHLLSETSAKLTFLAYRSMTFVGGIVIPPCTSPGMEFDTVTFLHVDGETRDTDQPPPSKDMR